MKYFHYFVSHFVWLFLVVGFTAFPMILPASHFVNDFICQNSDQKPFSSNSIPKIIPHITDNHISHASIESQDKFRKIVETIVHFSPDLIIGSGDFSNDYDKMTMPRVSGPRTDDWELYFNLSQPLRQFKYLEAMGNHDLWGHLNYSDVYYVKHFKQEEGSFYAQTAILEDSDQNYSFIGINPFSFPTGKDFMVFFGISSKIFLNFFEKEMKKSEELNNTIFLMSHYPYNLFEYSEKSDSKKTFKESIKQLKARVLISGHVHYAPSFVNHVEDGNILELIGVDSQEHYGFSVLTIDNSRFVYNTITNEEFDNEPFFITSPVPSNQVSKLLYGNSNNCPVRILLIADAKRVEKPKLEGTIDDKVINLECTAISGSSQKWLCENTDKTSLANGEHELTIRHRNYFGNITVKTVKFTAGNKIKGFKENGYLSKYNISYLIVSIAFVLVFYFVITFPVLLPFEKVSKESYEKRVNNDQVSEKQGTFAFWVLTLTGIFPLRWRLQNLCIVSKISLFIFAIWPLCFPLFFGDIGGKVAMYWLWGVVADGRNSRDPEMNFWAAIYLFLVFLPILFCFSGTGSSLGRPTIFDMLLILVYLGCIIYIEIWGIHNSAKVVGFISSPMVLVPVCAYSLLIWEVIHKRKSPNINEGISEIYQENLI